MLRKLLPFALILPGCAPSDRVELIASPAQQALVRNGTPALFSQKKHLVMLAANARAVKSYDRPSFTVAVRNSGTRPSLLSTSSFSASAASDKARVALKIFTFDELMKEEQNRQTVAAFAAALSAAGNAMAASQAGYTHTTGSISGGAYGKPYYGTYSATTYDPHRAQLASQAAQAKTASDFASLRAEGEANLERLHATILKDHTVLPGEWYGGVIVLAVAPKDQKGDAEYTISVQFDGETHEFRVKQARLQ